MHGTLSHPVKSKNKDGKYTNAHQCRNEKFGTHMV